jgi:hypothetical protein
MPLLRILLLMSLAIAPLACGGATKGMPRGWPDLVLASDTLCPNVAGRYFDSSDPITMLMAKRHVEWDSVEADWAYFELLGKADSGLTVKVVYRDSVEKTGVLRKGNAYDGDYYCDGGWLRMGETKSPSLWDAEVRTDDFYPKRHAFRLAPNEDGALVARLDFTDYAEFTVWCGDGCKGIPLPGTFETRSIWTMAEKFDPELPPPVARERQRAIAQTAAELERARNDRVWQEEQLAENGPPDPEKDLVRQRAVSALVPGMLLLGVGPTQGGWHLSLEFDELYQLEQYMVRLQGSGPVAELRVAPLFRTKMTTGRTTDVVFIRYQ